MASHRVLLTLNDELYFIVKRLSESTGTPAATLIVQLIESSKEQLKLTDEAVRLAKKGQTGAVVSKLQEMVTDVVQDIDDVRKGLKQVVEKK